MLKLDIKKRINLDNLKKLIDNNKNDKIINFN